MQSKRWLVCNWRTIWLPSIIPKWRQKKMNVLSLKTDAWHVLNTMFVLWIGFNYLSWTNYFFRFRWISIGEKQKKIHRKNNIWLNKRFSLFIFSVSFVLLLTELNLPRFAEPIPNITVTIGKDALLACVVDNLKSYRVSCGRKMNKKKWYHLFFCFDISNIIRVSVSIADAIHVQLFFCSKLSFSANA